MEQGRLTTNSPITFKDLLVWQKAHQFVLTIYRETEKFPTDERFGLTSQIRRASISVPANIAECFRKRSRKEKVYFYSISQTSLEEVRYYIILANDLKYWNQSELESELDAIGRLLEGLIKSIQSSERF
ncbi:four helix bundle protein [bacterium]|nr:MAG: four helix bundle protein [bacterium]